MKKFAAIMMVLGALGAICQAEPRWCSVMEKDPSAKIVYPPIAQAARVSGVVLAHMIYMPNGNVENVEPIFGPVMLSRSLSGQLAASELNLVVQMVWEQLEPSLRG